MLPQKDGIQRTLIFDYESKKWSNLPDLELESNYIRKGLMMTINGQLYLLSNFNETHAYDSEIHQWKGSQSDFLSKEMFLTVKSLKVFKF